MALAQSDSSGRERILEAATRLFATHGVAGTSLSQVAEASSMSKPSLLYHFGSKESLRRAVLEQLLDGWKELVPRLARAEKAGVSGKIVGQN